MRGIRVAKDAVRETLAAEFNAYLPGLRVELGLDDETLPDVVEFKRNEPQALDKWPIIAISGVRTGLTRHEVTEDANIAYVSEYTLRVFVWVRNQGWDLTIDQRDNLSGAVRRFLLDHPQLGVAGDLTLLDETGLAEEFSDVTPVKGDRFVAGSYVEFDVAAYEVIRRAPLGTVETTEAVVHPGLA